MKLQFEPYQLEPFADWYKWPTAFDIRRDIIIEYQMRLTEEQRALAEDLEDRKREYAERVYQIKHALAQELQP